MSVATLNTPKLTQSLTDWMRERFDGTNAGELAAAAAEIAVEQEYVHGPLWEEIGPQYLYRMFVAQLRASRRHALRPKAAEAGLDEWEKSSVADCGQAKVEFKYLPGINQWVDVLNVKKADINRIVAAYDNLVQGNVFEREFWKQIEAKLKKDQVVGDVFDYESLRELRSKMSKELKAIAV
jgi:hypothetical protein